MFPEKDQNEIYALVEAHYYKKDRVQVVIEELLRVERNSQDSSTLSHSFELETSVLGDYGTFFLLITYTVLQTLRIFYLLTCTEQYESIVI